MIPLSVKNSAHADVQLWSAGFYPNHRWRMTDFQGNEVALTAVGKAGAERFGSRERSKNVPVMVKPGQIHRYQTPPLTDAFHLVPGNYKLFIVYEDLSLGQKTRAEAREIEIRIRR
jgi:hypothetical protein